MNEQLSFSVREVMKIRSCLWHARCVWEERPTTVPDWAKDEIKQIDKLDAKVVKFLNGLGYNYPSFKELDQ